MIEVYTSQTCIQCRLVKNYLDEHGVKYEIKDISDQENKKFLLSHKIMTVPVVTNGETIIIGFKPGELNKIL